MTKYRSRFIILSHRQYIKSKHKKKESIFNLTVQYLKEYTTIAKQLGLLSGYITAAFLLAFRHPV